MEAPGWAPPLTLTSLLLAVLLVLSDADVALLQELVLEEPRVVLLVDGDDRQSDGRLLLLAVRAGRVDPRRCLAPEQGDGGRGGRVGLGGHVLVDGVRLPARDDVLHALDRCILSRERDRREPLGLD